MICSYCGGTLPEDNRKEAELAKIETLTWCGNVFLIEDKRRLITDEKNPLCEECWKKFLRWYVGP